MGSGGVGGGGGGTPTDLFIILKVLRVPLPPRTIPDPPLSVTQREYYSHSSLFNLSIR